MAYPVPARDPVSGGPLVITELEGPESGVTIRGRFEMPRFARLSAEQTHYLETFLRCRGMLNGVERELGISYPTARARLDAILKVLDLKGTRDELPPEEPVSTVEIPIELEDAPSPVESEAEPIFDGFEPFDPALEEPMSPAERPGAPRRSRDELLTLLERGEITVDELKKELGK